MILATVKNFMHEEVISNVLVGSTMGSWPMAQNLVSDLLSGTLISPISFEGLNSCMNPIESFTLLKISSWPSLSKDDEGAEPCEMKLLIIIYYVILIIDKYFTIIKYERIK